MKSRLIKFIITAVITALTIVLIFVFSAGFKNEGNILFYTYDSHGRLLNAYENEKDGLWYLFVTGSDDFEDVTLYSKEKIESVSHGRVVDDSISVEAAFSDGNTQLDVKTVNGVYKVIIMKSELPSIYIDLADTTLDNIHKDKDVVYYGNSMYISDPNNQHSVSLAGGVQIKGRGNSTWTVYEKKGYQLKFSESISLMGMDEAENWVLLAGSSDDSLIRTQLVYNMVKNMDMAFVPELKYVDLWIEGEYLGTYLFGEKIESDINRLNLKSTYGAIFEHDEAFYAEEEYWFYNERLQRHFVVKDMNKVKPALVKAASEDFSKNVDELITYLYTTPPSKVTLEELGRMIDVDSFIKYYLINEYVQNRESFATSFYWYKDGEEDVIHLGPVWDFDTCMGNDGASYYENYGCEHILFRYLLAGDEFYDRTQKLYEQYKDVLGSMAGNIDQLRSEIELSALMNYIRWDVLGKPSQKAGSDNAKTFDEAINNVKNWLINRAENFKISKSKVVTSVISDGCYELTMNFESEKKYNNVMFALWSVDGGSNDMRWYTADYNYNKGCYTFTADLADHNSAGIYRMVVYGDDMGEPIANGYNFVETVCERRYELKTEVSKDCVTMKIILTDSALCENMRFAVWSAKDNQDDLIWYFAKRVDDTTWVAEIDLKKHRSEGDYYIHAYTDTGTELKFIDDVISFVEFAVSDDKN